MKLKKLMIILVLFALLNTTTQAMLVNDVDKTVFEESIGTKTVSKWTVMYYMCEHMETYLDPLLENLTKIGSTSQLNIVTLTDEPGYGNSNLYYIDENGSKIKLNQKLNWPEEVDASDPNTFERFCEDIIKAFPAEHYAFITYANGGTGWQKYNFGDSNGWGLTTPEFAESLRKINSNINHKIDVLFTSCGMGTIELAYEISPYVDYMVTTQEHITGYRLVQRFYLAVKDLHNNSNMSPEQFAKKAAERHVPQTCLYMGSYGQKPSPLTKILDRLPFPGLHTVKIKTSVAILNLTKINNLFKSMQNLSSYLLLNLHDKKIQETIKTARKNAREYQKAYSKNCIINLLYSIFPLKLLSYDRFHPVNKIMTAFWGLAGKFYAKFPLEIFAYDCSIDLYNFTELISKNTENFYLKDLCCDVKTKINDSVTVIKKVQNDSSYGISIYFPSCKVLYNKYVIFGNTPSPYENLRFSQESYWDEFLKTYLDI